MKNKIQKYIFTGILTLIPIYVTYWVVKTCFKLFSTTGKSIITYIFKVNDLNNQWLIYLPDLLGFMLTIIFLYFLGLTISNVLGKKIYSIFEKILAKIPLVSYIYNTIKQITDTLSISQKQAFKKVVYIEYPKNNIWTIALVTGESKDSKGTEYYQIFVPTTPNPTSGFMLYVKKKDTIETKMSIDEGLKIIISGGMLAPEKNEI